jgi:hypothetical protein
LISSSFKHVSGALILVASLVGRAQATPPPPPEQPRLRTAQLQVKVKLIQAKAGTVESITPVCDIRGTIPVYAVSADAPSGHQGPVPGCVLTWKGKKLDVSITGSLSVSAAGAAEPTSWASASVSVTPPDARPGCDICGPQPLADARANVKISGASKSVTFELAPNPVSILRSSPNVWFEAIVTITDSK